VVEVKLATQKGRIDPFGQKRPPSSLLLGGPFCFRYHTPLTCPHLDSLYGHVQVEALRLVSAMVKVCVPTVNLALQTSRATSIPICNSGPDVL